MTITKQTRFAKKTVLASAISTALLAVAMPSVAESATDSATEFAKAGDVIAEIRLRYEGVQDDNDAKDDANATTARLRLGYETASLAGFKALVEYDQIIALQSDYNSGSDF